MKARPAQGLLAQRLVALFLAGGVLLDFPLLKLALGGEGVGSASLLGLPRLPLLLFAAWALLIVLLAVLMERADADDDAVATSPDER